MALTAEQLAGSPSRHRREGAVKYALLGAALFSILISFLIIYSLLSEAWVFIRDVDWGVTWGQIGWFPRRGIYDMPTLLIASLWSTVIAMVVAGPIGLAAAIYLSEYAKPSVRRVLKPILEVLAGIPSVVLGFFALLFIAPNIVGNVGGNSFTAITTWAVGTFLVMAVLFYMIAKIRVGRGGEVTRAEVLVPSIFLGLAAGTIVFLASPSGADSGSIMAAGIGVGILTIPLVASISEDAMNAVPLSLREASAGLGARKVSTTMQIVLPAAISGVVAAFIVAISRAFGETMVVFMAGGAADAASYTASPYDGSLTMTAAMASLASGTDSVVGADLTFQSLFFVGLVLFAITLTLNVIGNAFVERVREKY